MRSVILWAYLEAGVWGWLLSEEEQPAWTQALLAGCLLLSFLVFLRDLGSTSKSSP